MHGPICPCCAPGRSGTGAGAGSLLAGLAAMVAALAGVVAIAAGRFLSGRVLFRRVGPWDARYRTWAAPVPPEVTAMRGVAYPRTQWARRPGCHRQAARLAVVVLGAALLVAPVLTVAALGGAGIAGALAWVHHARTRTPDPVDPWHDPAAGWEVTPGPADDYARASVPPYATWGAPRVEPYSPVHVLASRLDRPRYRHEEWY